MIGPTFCFPIKVGFKILVVIDLVLAIVLFTMSGGGFIYFEIHQTQLLELFRTPSASPFLSNFSYFVNFKQLSVTSLRIFFACSTTYWLQKFGLGILLVLSLYRASARLVRVWILYTLILLCFSVCMFLGSVCVGVAEPYSIPVYIGVFLIREYSMWIVSIYLKHLRRAKANFSHYRESNI